VLFPHTKSVIEPGLVFRSSDHNDRKKSFWCTYPIGPTCMVYNHNVSLKPTCSKFPVARSRSKWKEVMSHRGRSAHGERCSGRVGNTWPEDERVKKERETSRGKNKRVAAQIKNPHHGSELKKGFCLFSDSCAAIYLLFTKG